LEGARFAHVPDLGEIDDPAARAAVELAGVRTVLFIPLRKDGILLGLISAARQEVKPFTEKEIGLLESFAAQAVIAIENARLFNETQEALERQTATADILKVIASSPSDTQPVFDAIAASANRLLGGFSSTVFLFIDGVAYLGAFTPTNPEADELLKSTFPRPAADFAPIRMTQHGEVVHVPDTEGLTDEIKSVARARGYRSMLFAPLMNKGAVIGFIAVTRVQPGSFTDHHVQLLQTFADQAVIAIENVRLFNEVQERTIELSASLQQQTATADVLKVISRSAFDLQAVLDTLISSAVELIGAIDGVIFLREEDGYRYRAAAGVGSEMMEFLASHPPTAGRHSAAGRVILYGDVQTVTDVLDDPDYDLPVSS
jgi:GAF domain-containing protein